MYAYLPTPETDLLFLRWWDEMIQRGELVPAFGPNMLVLSKFFSSFQPPTVCRYFTDGDRLWCVTWVEPALGGGLVCLWISPDRRQTKQGILAMIEALEDFFVIWPVLL